MHPIGNPAILDVLVSKELITSEQREAVLNHQRVVGGRIEEALLDLNAISEATLLKALAAEAKTQFVASEKLARADIGGPTLRMVPKKMAEQEVVFPVLFDAKTKTLSIVTPDPDDMELLSAVQLEAKVKHVRALLARPLAVKAAVAKAYNGDIHAFALLDKGAHEQFSSMLNVYERNLVSEESMAVALADEPSKERVLSREELEGGGSSGGGMNAKGMASETYLESLNVLISLLENTRSDLRGHSSHVARLVKKIGERIGLSEIQTAAHQIAAYLHDVGKMSAYHLTALNVAEYDGHRAAAKKSFKAPLRLMESVGLPQETQRALASMYERFDGSGIPGDHSGKEIPLGARLLAIADTYADLTQNPRNPFKATLRPAQACEVLDRYRGKVFDPNLVDLFKHTVTGEDLKARLLANRYVALVVEPDPEESTVLELRMIEQGFEVRIARTVDKALKQLDTGEVQIVVSEVDLGKHDGFSLLTEAKRRGESKLPWVFVTTRSGRVDAQKAFELGAADYMTKPVAPEVLVAKLKQVLEREAASTGARGVAGSLQEMGLPDIIQVLWHGRKTGSLKIRGQKAQGEIHFVQGAVYNALWGTLRGAEAFYAMLALGDGDFVLDPNFVAPQRVMDESPEGLLLEGMRRLDEGASRAV
jgi:response regulator RpfG family c-di-GMP phosphodiesterase